MPRSDRTGDRTATLYARSDLPRPATERRNDVGARLASVAATDAIDGFDVVHWPKHVPVQGAAGRERALLSEFREWADSQGVGLAPCFETRRCYSQESGECRREVVLPALCLAVYEAGELVELAPHATTDGVVTVSDALEELRGDVDQNHGDGDDRDERALQTAD